jgi:phosphoglycerate dehydrogenase-like enzyme
MQALLPLGSHQRLADRIRAVAPDLDIVTMDAEGRLARDSAALEADDISPEVFWISRDLFGGGYMPYFRALVSSQSAKWVQTAMAGVEHPAFKALPERGVRVSNSSAQAPAIADFVAIHALSLLHPIGAQGEQQAAHAWTAVDFTEAADTRWLIIGFGHIGKEIAKRAKGFGAMVEAVRRSPNPEGLADAVSTLADLPKTLPTADVVVLACALTGETRDIANATFFGAMKPGSILINIGRGGLLDEDALKVALDAGKPAWAVLDVFRTEPLPADSWIWDHPQVRVTPHASNRGSGVNARGDELFLENLRRYVAGEPLLNLVRPEDIGAGGD